MAAKDDVPDVPASAGVLSIDLDRERAARREGRGDNIEVTNHGVRFLLPVELPVEAVEPLAALAELEEDDDTLETVQLRLIRESLEGGLAVLFCNEPEPPAGPDGKPAWEVGQHSVTCQWREFRDTRPSLDDELALWAGLFAAYGTSLGEALASLDSSASDGAPSQLTSSGSTASTRARSGSAGVRVKPNRAAKRAAARKKAATARKTAKAAAAVPGSPG